MNNSVIRIGGGKNRLTEIDAIKGVSILFIVMIHSLCEHPVDLRGNLPLLSSMSSSFALCMFFVVSGFLYHHDETPMKEFFKKKVSRLLYPFLFFGTADILLRFAFSSITYNPQNGDLIHGAWRIISGQVYWFLYSMFLILLVNRCCYKIRWWIAGACLVALLCGLPEIPEFTLSRSMYYNVWFCLGFWISKRYGVMKEFALKHYWLLLAIAICGYAGTLMVHEKLITSWVLQLFGCGLIWLLCLKIADNKVLLHLGKYSMQYYTIHLLICFVFYYIGAWVFGHTASYLIAFVSVYSSMLFTTFIGLLIEKKIKFMYPVWGL